MKSLLTPAALIRMLADAILVSLAYALALMTRLMIVLRFERSQDVIPLQLVSQYVQIYLSSLPVLLFISATVFAIFGFYTKGRAYTSRYKMLIILQAASVALLGFGFLGFLLPEQVNPPRSVIPLTWLFSVALLISSRLWSEFWRRQVIKEIAPGRQKHVPERSVLVIGGAGYIGSALVPMLLDSGYKVRLLDVLLYGKEPIRPVMNHPNLQIIEADFRQVDKVVEAMQGVNSVVHLGGLVGDPACALDENLTIEINLMATRMIAEVAKGSGVSRFVFASTCSVYGASDQTLNECSKLNPLSLYARSKVASERVLAMMANEKFAVVNLRFGTVYGLSGRIRFDLVVNLLTAKAIFEKKITVFGGDQWRPFVHVSDAALGVFKVLNAPTELIRGQTFNVGSNQQNMTLSQVGQLVKRLVPEAQLIELGQDGDRRNYRVDFSKIHNQLGFEPQWTVESGINQVIYAIRSGRIKDYRDPAYSNVKYLSEDSSSEVVKRYYAGWERELLKDVAPNLSAAVVPTVAVSNRAG